MSFTWFHAKCFSMFGLRTGKPKVGVAAKVIQEISFAVSD